MFASTRLRAHEAVLALTGFVALSFFVFYPCLRGEFVSDDVNAIVNNELVANSLRPLEIFGSFSWWGSARADAPGYRPLTTLSFALNRAAAGLGTAAYHLVNMILHGVVSWLVLMIGLRLGMQVRAALIAATAFCLLPIHTEAVAWIVGRAELLAAAGWAGALVLLLAYRTTGGVAYLGAAAPVFLLGLFSKENAVTLLAAPPLLAIVMPLPPARRRRDATAAAVLLATLALYIGVRATAGPLLPASTADGLDNPLSILGQPARLAGALSVLGHYTTLIVWPHPLTVDYSFDALGIGPGFTGDRYTALGLATVAGLGWTAWRVRASAPTVTLSLLLAGASYAIVSNLIVLIGTIMGERLVYLPTVGLALAAGPPLAALTYERPRLAWVLVLLVATAWAATSHQRAGEWRSAVTLFEAAARATPRSARAHMELGGAYGRAGRADDAIAAFQRALEIKPDYAAALYNLGNHHARRGLYDAAVDAYSLALEHAPDLVAAWYNLGIVRQQQGRPAEAAEAFGRAAEIAPRDGGLHFSQADALRIAGRYDEAVEAYTKALQNGAPPAATLVNRGVAKQASGGCDLALEDYLEATAVTGAPAMAFTNAIACLQSMGRVDEARAIAKRLEIAKQKHGR